MFDNWNERHFEEATVGSFYFSHNYGIRTDTFKNT
jgi:hypothetical protein